VSRLVILTAAVILGAGVRGEIDDEVELPDAEAADLISRRRARYVDAVADPGLVTSVAPVGTGASAVPPAGDAPPAALGDGAA
jgi:hypothetical protein